MGKSVVNEEFAAVSSAHYAKAGFARRRKGQRYMADLLPMFLFGDELQGHSVELLGTGLAYNAGGQVVSCDHLLVTTPAGARVPAYRLEAPHFNICQSHGYVPA